MTGESPHQTAAIEAVTVSVRAAAVAPDRSGNPDLDPERTGARRVVESRDVGVVSCDRAAF